MYIASDFELRSASINEVNKIQKLIHRTIDISYTEFYNSTGKDFSKMFHSIAAISDRMKFGNVLVVAEGDCIVATGASLGNKIFGVFVLPEKQRRGYGKTVMEALERLLKSQGIDKVILDISLTSLDFYQSLGYVVTGETDLALEDGSHFKMFTAEKELGAI